MKKELGPEHQNNQTQLIAGVIAGGAGPRPPHGPLCALATRLWRAQQAIGYDFTTYIVVIKMYRYQWSRSLLYKAKS